MSTEVALEYGGDFQLDSTGDLLLVNDANGTFTALQQRIVRLLLTSPLAVDGAGNPISEPDDLFNPGVGVGLRAYVGSGSSPAMLAEVETRIRQGLAQEPDVAAYPAPVIDFSVYIDAVVCNVTVTTISGITVALPPITVSPAGA